MLYRKCWKEKLICFDETTQPDYQIDIAKTQLGNEKRAPSCLGYIGDEILPSYVGL